MVLLGFVHVLDHTRIIEMADSSGSQPAGQVTTSQVEWSHHFNAA
jgi:hypothetical protein